MDRLSRRTVVSTLGLGAAVMAQGTSSKTPSPSVPAAPAPIPAYAGAHQPKPLRFDPGRLDGLSERLIRSHWENNYVGSVKALNMIEGRIAAALADPELLPQVYGGLKREQLHRTGSVILHEIYFDGLGGDGRPGGGIRDALATTFGTVEAWEADFRRTAMSLAGGSGWAVLSWNLHARALQNHWAWDHMHGAVAGAPLLALDMYEHSFHLDYGAAAARYVDAFFRNVDWALIDRRFAAVRGAGIA